MLEFNVTGSCMPDLHYMVDISNKLVEIKKLVDTGKYFTINSARQYGKTTTRYALEERIKTEYVVINISFEGIGDSVFKDEKNFVGRIFDIFADSVKFTNKDLEEELRNHGKGLKNFSDLSRRISEFCHNQKKKTILIIDEVDKGSNNHLFISFLGMLREKYLARNANRDVTFYSVILLGVYDVKNLKVKFVQEHDRKYNSPWNIAADFEVDMSFSSYEISTMLEEYEKYNNTGMDIVALSSEIYRYTSGYPFLVSKICKIIDEKLHKTWTIKGIEEAVKILLEEKNTLFEDLIKNLEHNKELYNSIYNQIVLGEEYTFNIDNPITNLGVIFAIFKKENGKRVIHNKIFEQRIYGYMASKLEDRESLSPYNFRNNFIEESGDLNIEKILQKFQQMMKEEYSKRDKAFLEREGRLLFIAFLRPIINGVGFALKEVQISEEQRLDILITYNNKKYVIELKKWYGEEYHKRGLEQLERYLENQNLDKGYLIIFDFRSQKKYTSKSYNSNKKQIHEITI